MVMKKVGIITHYYGSTNYGGLLQAYALCRKLKELGVDAEQIQYLHEDASSSKANRRKFTPRRIYSSVFYRITQITRRRFYKNMQLRNDSLKRFRESIPHSREVYTRENIFLSNKEYDIFVTGSDQVWNMDWYDEAYFLTFVEGDKTKCSYAASLGTSQLTTDRKAILRKNVKGYSLVSVREEDSVDLVKSVIDQDVELVLDPTLLLGQEEWNKISEKRLIEGSYAFCYFLGDSQEDRKLAELYAKEKNLQLVTLPYLDGKKRKCDDGFKALKLYDISPGDFMSLIKYSDAVFTDSFHASVFSILYEKNFFVFPRSQGEKMSNRITSLTKMFGNEERFCRSDERHSLAYICSLETRKNTRTDYEKLLENSIRYLKNLN